MSRKYVPNALTISRGGVGVAIFTLYYLGYGTWLERLVILLIYVAAAVTDAIDGRLARRWKCESPFGGTADPVADKVLFWLTSWILWRQWHDYLTPTTLGIEEIFFASVMLYDVVTTMLRILKSFGVIERMYTTRLAKWKTIYLLSGLGVFLACEVAVAYLGAMPFLLPSLFVLVYATVGIGLTVASAIAYAWVCAVAKPAASAA